MKKTTATFLLLLAGRAWAGGFDATGIPPGLLPHAHAVVRASETEISIRSPKDIRVRRHIVVTVLDEKGKKAAHLLETSSQYEQIETVEGTLYDAAGAKVDKMGKKQLVRHGMPSELIFHSDDAAHIHSFSRSTYPYTVEYWTEVRSTQSFLLPEWRPQPSADCAVEEASLTVSAPSRESLKYRSFHTPEPEVLPAVPFSIAWRVRQLEAEEEERPTIPGDPGEPTVYLALSPFVLDEYQGTSASWKTFGAFMYDLNKGRDVLDKTTIARINELVKDEQDPVKKIHILYRHLQRNCRYVSLEYGIGGWQTLDAAFVSGNGIGDCKALTNYMMSMLAVVGISSYPVLVYAGADPGMPMDNDFPRNQFNHVILCVPLGRDSLWLECTSNTIAPGYLGDFTDDRDALMITPGGGIKVHTPLYDEQYNFWSRHTQAQIDTGNIELVVDMKGCASGLFHLDLLRAVQSKTAKEKELYLNTRLSLSSYEVTNYQYVDSATDRLPLLYENMNYRSAGLVRVQGNRLFVNMNMLPITAGEKKKRKAALFFPRAYVIRDTFSLSLPAGYSVEQQPADISMDPPFAHYSLVWTRSAGKLTAVRTFRRNKGMFSAEQYALYEALQQVLTQEKQMAVVLKKE